MIASMVRPQIAAALLDLACGATSGEELRRQGAIEMVLKIAALTEIRHEPWWRWTSWLAAAITVRRIENI